MEKRISLITIEFQVRCSYFYSYVYWTVHHLDTWINRDQLGVTCFIISLFNAQHISEVNTSILRSLRLICWVISWVELLWFDVCWCYVVVWLWWCGIRMQAEALVLVSWCYVVVWLWWCGMRMQAAAAASACIRMPHHHSQTTT